MEYLVLGGTEDGSYEARSAAYLWEYLASDRVQETTEVLPNAGIRSMEYPGRLIHYSLSLPSFQQARACASPLVVGISYLRSMGVGTPYTEYCYAANHIRTQYRVDGWQVNPSSLLLLWME